MRIIATGLFLALATLSAEASSFVYLGASDAKDGSSLTVAGSASKGSIIVAGTDRTSPSIVALVARTPGPVSVATAGAPAKTPDVSGEKVAAIGAAPKVAHRMRREPILIRGGIVEGASEASRPAPVQVVDQPVSAGATPAGGEASAAAAPKPTPAIAKPVKTVPVSSPK